MRTLFIVNPAAGRGRSYQIWQQTMPLLRAQGDFDVVYTKARGDAVTLARQAADKGYDRVAAVGGDGTMFEVVNGLVGSQTALAIVPGGTGNDYAKHLGLPLSVGEAAALALNGRTRGVDIGRISNGVHFINVAGAGFDAEVATRVNRYPKYLGGTIPYVAGVVLTLWQYSPQELEIEIDGMPHLRERVLLLALGLGPTYGGGMRIAPNAVVDDGYFDICIAGDIGKGEALRVFPRVYQGTHADHPKVKILRGKQVSLRSKNPIAIQADGEVVGQLPAEFTLLPRALQVVCKR